ncbi:unnamed protein product [Sphagnum balticum]
MRQCARSRLEQDGLVCLLDCDDVFTGGVVGSSAPVMYTFYIWIRIVYALAYVPKESVLVVYDSIEWPDVLHDFLSRYFEGLSPVVTLINCNMLQFRFLAYAWAAGVVHRCVPLTSGTCSIVAIANKCVRTTRATVRMRT